MNYAKSLLKKEKVELKKYDLMASFFEMLCNQQAIHNVAEKGFELLKPLEGELAMIRFAHDRFQLVSKVGNTKIVERHLENRTLLKKVRDTKQPYFGKDCEEGVDCFMILPILSKEEFLGMLCIYKEQKITCWEEIYTFLHMMALSLKYYDVIETNKTSNIVDNITELFNYRHFRDQLELEMDKSNKYHIPLSLVMIDVVNFSLINEKLGFESGDIILREVGEIIKKSCRKVDMPARLNDDHFAILLSNTDVKGAYVLLNRILLSIRRHKFNVHGKEFKIKVKLSAVPFEIHQNSGTQFIEKGEMALKEYTPEEVLGLIEGKEQQ